jgi:HD-GYP domain-containing protein (c-di-GMP phosphodiesterase class II)
MEAEKTRKYLASQRYQVARFISSTDEDNLFSHLFLRSVIPEGQLTFPLFLKAVENTSKKIQYLPFCAAGEVFQAEWLIHLKQREIDRLYFRKEDLDKVIAYVNNHLLFLEDDNPEAGPMKVMVLYDHLHLTLQQALAGPNLKSSTGPAIQQVEQILTELEQEPFPFASLWEALCLEYSLYNHAVNVFLLSTSFMHSLKMDPGECRSMGIAALFHDVGLVKIPPEILYKPGTLNQKERLLVQQHPQLGYDMLETYPVLPLESLRLILEHHENSDGSGYPQGLELWRQHPYTQILRLVDAYDALTSQRSYRSAYNSLQAIKILQDQKGPGGSVFDQGLLRYFIRFLAL